MSKIFVVYNDLPAPAKISANLYLGSVLVYNFCSSYSSSKMYLDKFRAGTLNYPETQKITDEWSAVKYGAHINFYDRFINSFIWPFSLSKDIIPWIVLSLNKLPKPKKNKENDDNKTN